MKKDVAIEVLEAAKVLGGVFSRADLEVLLDVSVGSSMARKLAPLIKSGRLRRFSRGWYITPDAQLPILFQRLVPDGYVSLTWALSKHSLIGLRPEFEIAGFHSRRPVSYGRASPRVAVHHAADHLMFGFATIGGVRYADAQKAVLDTLLLHMHGQRFPFDVYSDIDFEKLDITQVSMYLERYHNPKFVRFAQSLILGES